MALLVIFAAVATFLVLIPILSAVGCALWYALGVLVQWFSSDPHPWTGWQPGWWKPPVLLAAAVAAVYTAVGCFGMRKEVFRSPSVKGVRIVFREPSLWQDTAFDRQCSDCYTHVRITHVGDGNRRTTTEVTEWSREYYGEPVRKVRWAVNGSDRAVVTTGYGELLFLPDLLHLSHDVPEAAIRAYLQGLPLAAVGEHLSGQQ
jgi:hypothetical protein